jgi:hypothetical protein
VPYEILTAALFCFLTIPAATASAQDFQSWNEIDLTASVHHVDLLVPLLARTDTSLPNPQLAAAGLTADLHLPMHLTLTPGYLFVDIPRSGYRVNVPLIAVTESLHLGRYTAADRSRFEKLFNYPTSPVRYRNRLLFDYALGRAHLLLDDEIFFNLTADNFSQNRLQSGAGTRLTSRLSLDLYYLQKNPASGAATHVLGSTLRISLTPPPPPRLPSHIP